jgi:hypothetical protein
MTEHSAVIFVFFFLAEYASIVLICILTSILFLGGYLLNITPLIYIFLFFDIITVFLVNQLNISFLFLYDLVMNNLHTFNTEYTSPISITSAIHKYLNGDYVEYFIIEKESILFNPLFEGIFCGVILGIKSCIMIFIFI